LAIAGSRSRCTARAALVFGLAPSLLPLLAPVSTSAAEPPVGCVQVARIVSVQGSLQILRSGQSTWSVVRKLDTALCQGDLLHAGPRSRAALLIAPETLVRLDQSTTLSVSQTKDETIVEFAKDPGLFQPVLGAPNPCGAGYFITRFPRKFRVLTPFIDATVEGTEFLVAMRCESTQVAVFEGRVLAQDVQNASSRAFSLKEGEALEVGGPQPPGIKLLVKPVDAVQWALYYPPITDAAGESAADQKCDQDDPAARSVCILQRAEQRLRSGRVEEAEGDIQTLLTLGLGDGDAYALLSIISVVKNDKAKALELANRATQLSPNSPRAWLALSYAEQAGFALDKALAAAKKAAALAPASSLAQARVAELLMSSGYIRDAEKAAQAAIKANPNDARAYTVLGFVHLAEIDTTKAKHDFLTAIELDSTDPLPRLGLGLAIIRDGKLEEGRQQLEIAVILDPSNSLLRSYVGQAYYEENTAERDKLAAAQYNIAEKLDSNDPTPWFYAAILKETQNRPIEALGDLEKSIELNSKRGVYRSQLSLDQDLAVRGSTAAQIYDELGFEQAGIVEASKSLMLDPGSPSTHRFLSDLYVSQPRAEIARASELLQAQMRAPLGTAALQAQLANDDLARLTKSVPINVGFNEYDSLFLRTGANLQLYGLLGEQATTADQVVLNVNTGRVAVSLSQFMFDTDGFRDNNQNQRHLYDGFIQAQLTPATSIQAEFAGQDQSYGDLIVSFDPSFGQSTTNTKIGTGRIGLRQVLTPNSDVLVSASYVNRRDSREFPGFGVFLETQNKTWKVEGQNLTTFPFGHLVTGVSYFEGEEIASSVFFPTVESEPTHFNAYTYGYIPIPGLRATAQLGLSFDDLKASNSGEIQKLNPKVGIVWTPTQATTLRAAYFTAVRRRINSDPGLEPTNVAGFNQYFDDINGAESTTLAAAIDQWIGSKVRVGLGGGQRDISSPLINGTVIDFDPWNENQVYGYVYWLPAKWLAVSLDPRWEKFQRPLGASDEGFTEVQTAFVPLTLRMFSQSGLAAGATITYVKQSGTFYDIFLSNIYDAQEAFTVVDLAISYRLPARHGVISVGVRNAFDQQFQFQSTDRTGSPVAMTRFAFMSAVLNF